MNSEDSRNLILAIALSVLVLIGWQYFFAAPQLQKDRARPAAGADANPAADQRRARRRPAARRRRARARAARRAGAGRAEDARRSARRQPAGRHRHAEPRRLDRPRRRHDRRRGAEGLPRDDRPEEPQHHPVFAGRRADALLGRDRLRHRRGRREDPQPPDSVERRLDDADGGEAGDAELGQRRRAEVQARHRHRRQIHVHRARLGGERRRRAGVAAPLCADPAPRQARRRRLRRAARGLRRRHRRRLGAGDHLRQHREGDRPRPRTQGRRRLARLHRQVLGLGDHSRPDRADRRALLVERRGAAGRLPDRLRRPGDRGRARRDRLGHGAGVRRREGSRRRSTPTARTSASRSSI